VTVFQVGGGQIAADLFEFVAQLDFGVCRWWFCLSLLQGCTKNEVKYVGHIRCHFFDGHVYLIDVWLGEDRRTNSIKTNATQLGGPLYLVDETNKHGLLIIMTKSREV
jgi:hypothetical protein